MTGSPFNICSNCEIPILPGTDHRYDDGCFVALKQYVKLCQDDIESSRMRDFQHPTRDELATELEYLEKEFEKYTIYVNSVLARIQKARRGTLVG